jgi:hypothetical protein
VLVKYSAEQLGDIAAKLRQLPPVTDSKTLTKRDAVAVLAEEILALKDRGYTLDQIAEALGNSGLQISTPTLKNYLNRTKAKRSKGARKRRRTARPATTGPSAATFEATPDTRDI